VRAGGELEGGLRGLRGQHHAAEQRAVRRRRAAAAHR
jgi:hypothetical protein